MTRVLAVVGAGPGLGMALARRFGREGFRVGLVARNAARLDAHVSELSSEGHEVCGAVADVRDVDALRGALQRLQDELGPIEVLEYSPLVNMGDLQLVTEMTLDRLHEHFDLSVTGAVTAVGEVLPHMLESGNGGILITTGATAQWPSATHGSACIAVGALRHYLRMLSDVVAHQGVYVGSISIARPGRRKQLADTYWDMYVKRDRVEVIFGDPEAMHCFELLVLRGHAEWFPEPRLLEVPVPADSAQRRELLLALYQARLMARPTPEHAPYRQWLDQQVRLQGGDPALERCGA